VQNNFAPPAESILLLSHQPILVVQTGYAIGAAGCRSFSPRMSEEFPTVGDFRISADHTILLSL